MAALWGCGRPATEADCQLVVDRSVELSAAEKNIVDAKEVERYKSEAKKALSAELGRCVGRRITDGMIRCASAAQSSKELERCMQ